MASGKLFRQVYAGFLRAVKQNVSFLYESNAQRIIFQSPKTIDLSNKPAIVFFCYSIQVKIKKE